jgi:hypothetical protein
VFELCRYLKVIPYLANAETARLRSIVREWHTRALPFIRTKGFVDTWADFLSGWDRVNSPAGQGPIDEAFRRAEKWREWKKEEQPLKAVQLYADEPRLILLAALCKVLQLAARRDGSEDFFLDCRTAGRLLRIPHKRAWQWLTVLCADGILEVREIGSLATHRASQYRYVAWKRTQI